MQKALQVLSSQQSFVAYKESKSSTGNAVKLFSLKSSSYWKVDEKRAKMFYDSAWLGLSIVYVELLNNEPPKQSLKQGIRLTKLAKIETTVCNVVYKAQFFRIFWWCMEWQVNLLKVNLCDVVYYNSFERHVSI